MLAMHQKKHYLVTEIQSTIIEKSMLNEHQNSYYKHKNKNEIDIM